MGNGVSNGVKAIGGNAVKHGVSGTFGAAVLYLLFEISTKLSGLDAAFARVADKVDLLVRLATK